MITFYTVLSLITSTSSAIPINILPKTDTELAAYIYQIPTAVCEFTPGFATDQACEQVEYSACDEDDES